MNTVHRLERVILDFGDYKRRMHRELLATFLEDDHLSSRERQTLDLFGREFDEPHDELAQYRADQVAAHDLERNGATRQTVRHFKAAGYTLAVIDLEAHREARCPKIVPFPTTHRNEAS